VINSGEILFIDDEEDVRLSGCQTLEIEGLSAIGLSSAEHALDYVSQSWPGILISDIKMPGMDGMALLDRVLEIDPGLPVILITGHGDIQMAVEAMRRGAYDFIEKPADPDRLIEVAERALDKRRLEVENRNLRQEIDSLGEMERRVIGKTPVVDRLRALIMDLADTEVDVLIVGETGTGKELAARCLHDFGSRRDKRFVALNCGALPESVIESELFGHEAGAFTGATKRRIGKIEYAEGGFLFLDEIESMTPAVQVRLLRVLQERTIERLGGNDPIDVDIRVVAASKVDLREAANEGSFREDLYYRLHVASIDLPPLRARQADIPFLFGQFADAAGLRYRRPVPEISSDRIRKLMDRNWPGNVRELRNAAERFVLGMSRAGGADPSDVPSVVTGETLAEQVDQFEHTIITGALKAHGGRVGDTANALGLPRKTLYLRMQKYGLERDDYR
jgi:two-component system, NtrC family, C4-dicarboxylate transport response regulator DctD